MSDATKPVLTWVRLLVGLGIFLFGLTASLDSVSTTETPSRHCNGTAIQVAFSGGRGPQDLKDACRGEGRGQVEAGLFVSAIGVVLVVERRVRRWAKARDAREAGVTIWRVGSPWRPIAVVTVSCLVVLTFTAGGWDPWSWVGGAVLFAPVMLPLVLFVIRPRIEARPDRLVVQNAIDGRSVAWAEVAGVEATRRGVEVSLRNGGRIRASAVRAPTRADAVVAAVRARARLADTSPALVFGWGAAEAPPPLPPPPPVLPPPPPGSG